MLVKRGDEADTVIADDADDDAENVKEEEEEEEEEEDIIAGERGNVGTNDSNAGDDSFAKSFGDAAIAAVAVSFKGEENAEAADVDALVLPLAFDLSFPVV